MSVRSYAPQQCGGCYAVKYVMCLELDKGGYVNYAPLCRECLWIYTHLYRIDAATAYDKINKIHNSPSVFPQNYSISYVAPPAQCSYGTHLITRDTYLGLLPADMVKAVLVPYICSNRPTRNMHRTSFGNTTAPVLGTDHHESVPAVVVHSTPYCETHVQYRVQ